MRDDVFERDAVLDARAFQLQRAFRALLDAMARPGEVCELPSPTPTASDDAAAAGLFPSTVTVADVLLDAATTLACAGGDAARETAGRTLSRRTHVLGATPEAAAYAVVPLDVDGGEAGAFVTALSPGNLLDPQLGATCVVECGVLLGRDGSGARTGSASGSRAARACSLEGPGIAGTARLECDRVDVLSARDERRDEFPCGIDLVLVDRAGHVVCLPRTTRIVWEEEVPSWDM